MSKKTGFKNKNAFCVPNFLPVKRLIFLDFILFSFVNNKTDVEPVSHTAVTYVATYLQSICSQ